MRTHSASKMRTRVSADIYFVFILSLSEIDTHLENVW